MAAGGVAWRLAKKIGEMAAAWRKESGDISGGGLKWLKMASASAKNGECSGGAAAMKIAAWRRSIRPKLAKIKSAASKRQEAWHQSEWRRGGGGIMAKALAMALRISGALARRHAHRAIGRRGGNVSARHQKRASKI
jgi:hypothetical protein